MVGRERMSGLFPIYLSFLSTFFPAKDSAVCDRCMQGKMARRSELSFMRVHAVSNGLGACMGCRAQGKRGKGR